MTQSQETTTPAAASKPDLEAEPKKPVTIADVGQAIEDEAGIDFASIKKGALYTFYPPGSSKPITIKFGAPWPMHLASTVMGIFHDTDEVRVYVLGEASKSKDEEEMPPTCFTIHKVSASIVGETMTLDVFIDEVASEFSEADDVGEEREAVTEFLKALPADYSVHQAAKDIEAELHVIEDDMRKVGVGPEEG